MFQSAVGENMMMMKNGLSWVILLLLETVNLIK